MLAAAARPRVAPRAPLRAACPRRAVARPLLVRASPPPSSLPPPPDSDDDTGRTRPGARSPLASDDADALFPDDGAVASVALPRTRRSRMVAFTCNKCDARTERRVNPRAWERGTVFLQCGGCGEWHKVRDELALVDEVVFPENARSALAKADAAGELSFAEEAALARATPPPVEGARPERE